MGPGDMVLWDRWARGRDAEAFTEIVRRHSGMVYATCRRILGNAAEAEEVAQDCFMRLAGGRVTVRSSLAGWLHTVATHLSINALKKDGRRRERERRFMAEMAPPPAVQWDDVSAFVDEAIASLPERLREPVILHFFEGQTHEAVARSLGVSQSTVTRHIQKGIDGIRRDLRRRRITVGAGALAALFSAQGAEAAPAGLMPALAKVALAGSEYAGAPLLLGTTLGVLAMKKIALVIVGLLVAAGAFWALSEKPSVKPEMTTPSADVLAHPRPQAEPERVEHAPSEIVSEAEAAAAPVANDTASISGRVFDGETNKGIPHVRIICHSIQGNGKGGGYTYTNENGYFLFDHVQPNQWGVSIVKREGIDDYIDPVPEEKKIHVRAGDVVENLDFALKRGVAISGVVVDEEDRPLAGASVSTGGELPRSWNRHATCGSDGRFVFRGIPAQPNIEINASPPDWGRNPPARVTVDAMADRDDVVVKIVLVEHATVEGRVINLDGLPVRHGGVILCDSSNRRLNSGVLSTKGEFCVNPVLPGTYSLAYQVEWNGQLFSDLAQIEVTDGDTVSDIILRVDQPSLAAGLTISGRITNRRGEPLTDLHVSAYTDNRQDVQTQSDANGNYVLKDLIEGTYSMRVGSRSTGISFAEDIEAGSSGVDFVMSKSGRIEGQVLRADTREPVTEYEVDYEDNILGYTWLPLPVKDPQGRFLLTGLQVETRTSHKSSQPKIIVKAPGFLRAEQSVQMISEEDGPVNVKILLERGARIEGVVIGPDGAPLFGATLYLDELPDGHSAYQTEQALLGLSAQDGTFAVDSLGAGAHKIWAVHSEYGTTFATVDVEPGKVHPVTVTFAETGSVQGCVMLDGIPLAGALVTATISDDEDDRRDIRLETDADGHYRFAGLPEGELRMSTCISTHDNADLPARYGIQRTEIFAACDVTAGQCARVDFLYPLGDAGVEGYAMQDGEPMPSESVYVMWDGGYCMGLTDGEGYYSIEGLPAETVRVTAGSRQDGNYTESRVTTRGGQSIRVDLELGQE